MMQKFHRNDNFNLGYTMVELIVIISIIGFVMTAALYAFNYSRTVSRDTKRVADLSQIRKAIEMFRNENGRYPALNSSGSFYSADGISNSGECLGDSPPAISDCGNSSAFEILMANYLNNIPPDPKHNHNCGIGGGSSCTNSTTNYFYSYDAPHLCPNGSTSKCAILCFHRSESGKYACGQNNPVCGGGTDMDQDAAVYCIVFDANFN